MFRPTCIGLLCVLALAAPGAQAIAPGIKSALHGNIAGHSDFELNLSPPSESAKDIEESLDALMKSEDVSSKALQADFASEKERMLEAEKVAIQEIVSSAFQSFLARH